MGIDDNTYDLIDQYLQGKLPDDHPFVQQLKENEALAQEVELRKLADIAILNYRLMDVEKLLDSRRSNFVAQKSSKWKWALGIFSTVGIATSVLYYSQSTDQKNTTKKPNNTPIQNQDLPQKESNEKTMTLPLQQETIRTETKTKTPKLAERSKALEINTFEYKQNSPAQVSENMPKTDQVPTKPKEELVHVGNEITTPANPCSGIRFLATVEEKRPCKGTTEGQLTIKNARGGEAPYHFSLDNEHFQESNLFDGLKPNEYNITLKDANGCVETVYQKYVLKSKSCIKHSEYIFNPNVTSWEVPNDPERQGELTILDENGNVVYSHTIEKQEKIYWNGTRNSGDLLIPGVYIYHIKYSGEMAEQGTIAITY